MCTYVVVQFYPLFQFYLSLFLTHYHTSTYPKTKGNKIELQYIYYWVIQGVGQFPGRAFTRVMFASFKNIQYYILLVLFFSFISNGRNQCSCSYQPREVYGPWPDILIIIIFIIIIIIIIIHSKYFSVSDWLKSHV